MVTYLCRRFKISQRQACAVVGQVRSTQRYTPVPSDFQARLVVEMITHAQAHPRWGYRRIHALLVAGRLAGHRQADRASVAGAGPESAAAAARPPGGKGPGIAENSAWARPAVRPGHIWSDDFMSLRTEDGRPLRLLNVVDEYTRVGVGFHVCPTDRDALGAAHSGPADRRARRPESDPCRTMARSSSPASWCDLLAANGIAAAPVQKGSPQQNCYIARFITAPCAASSSTARCSTACSGTTVLIRCQRA